MPSTTATQMLPSETVTNGFPGGLRLELKNVIKDELKGELRSELITALKNGLSREFEGEVDGTGPINGNSVAAPLQPVPQPSSTPPPSILSPICHPHVEDAIREVDSYYLQNWPFPDAKARKRFVGAGFSRVTCLYFPKALNDRINYACSLLTILFLIDDQLEQMSLADGERYNNSLMPLMRGDEKPDRSVPVQWMMYDLWEDMRKCDKELANETLEPTFTFMRAQTAKERLTVHGLGRYLQYRQGDVGQALLAALMRFSMGLHLSAEDFSSVEEVEKNCGRHISIVNDIYSYEKELQTSKTGHKEGAYLCSAVPIFSEETDLSIAAAKRGLWTLVREWEYVHDRLVRERIADPDGCNDAVIAYMNGLEYHMSGNELWSKTTKRYHAIGE